MKVSYLLTVGSLLWAADISGAQCPAIRPESSSSESTESLRTIHQKSGSSSKSGRTIAPPSSSGPGGGSGQVLPLESSSTSVSGRVPPSNSSTSASGVVHTPPPPPPSSPGSGVVRTPPPSSPLGSAATYTPPTSSSSYYLSEVLPSASSSLQPSSSASCGNLVADPDFSRGDQDWTFIATASADAEFPVQNCNGYGTCAELVLLGSAGGYVYTYQTVPLPHGVGAAYEISIRYRVVRSSGDGAFELVISRDETIDMVPGVATAPLNTWQSFGFEFTAEDNFVSLGVELSDAGANGAETAVEITDIVVALARCGAPPPPPSGPAGPSRSLPSSGTAGPSRSLPPVWSSNRPLLPSSSSVGPSVSTPSATISYPSQPSSSTLPCGNLVPDPFFDYSYEYWEFGVNPDASSTPLNGSVEFTLYGQSLGEAIADLLQPIELPQAGVTYLFSAQYRVTANSGDGNFRLACSLNGGQTAVANGITTAPLNEWITFGLQFYAAQNSTRIICELADPTAPGKATTVELTDIVLTPEHCRAPSSSGPAGPSRSSLQSSAHLPSPSSSHSRSVTPPPVTSSSASLPSSSALSCGNLVTDPDFSLGNTSWSFEQDATRGQVQAPVANCGGYSTCSQFITSGTSGGGPFVSQKIYNTQPLQQYSISIRYRVLKVSSDGAVSFPIFYDYAEQYVPVATAPLNKWQTFSFQFTAANQYYIDLSLALFDGPKTNGEETVVEVTEVVVTPVTCSATPSGPTPSPSFSLSSFPTSSACPNLVKDWDFERGYEYWDLGGTASSYAQVQDGSALLILVGSFAGQVAASQTIQGLTPGLAYRFSLAYQVTANSGDGTFRLLCGLDSTYVSVPGVTEAPLNTWMTFGFDYVATSAGPLYLTIELTDDTTAGRETDVVITDILLTPVACVPPLSSASVSATASSSSSSTFSSSLVILSSHWETLPGWSSSSQTPSSQTPPPSPSVWDTLPAWSSSSQTPLPSPPPSLCNELVTDGDFSYGADFWNAEGSPSGDATITYIDSDCGGGYATCAQLVTLGGAPGDARVAQDLGIWPVGGGPYDVSVRYRVLDNDGRYAQFGVALHDDATGRELRDQTADLHAAAVQPLGTWLTLAFQYDGPPGYQPGDTFGLLVQVYLNDSDVGDQTSSVQIADLSVVGENTFCGVPVPR